jgi:anaerobic magnesium-protoporphyrin IX monomethyl ester cyclase
MLFQRDLEYRHSMRWYTSLGRRVWPYEIWNFLFRDRRIADGPTLEAHWGRPQDGQEYAMRPRRRDEKSVEMAKAA